MAFDPFDVVVVSGHVGKEGHVCLGSDFLFALNGDGRGMSCEVRQHIAFQTNQHGDRISRTGEDQLGVSVSKPHGFSWFLGDAMKDLFHATCFKGCGHVIEFALRNTATEDEHIVAFQVALQPIYGGVEVVAEMVETELVEASSPQRGSRSVHIGLANLMG